MAYLNVETMILLQFSRLIYHILPVVVVDNHLVVFPRNPFHQIRMLVCCILGYTCHRFSWLDNSHLGNQRYMILRWALELVLALELVDLVPDCHFESLGFPFSIDKKLNFIMIYIKFN